MSPRSRIILAFTLLCACGDPADDSNTAPDTGDGSSVGDDTADTLTDSTGADPDPFACVDPDFTVEMPLAGPGYDPQVGLIDPQAKYVVTTTQALPPPDRVAEFGQLAGAAAMAAAQSPGLVAMGFASEPNCGFQRTLTVWRDEDAMMAFVVSPAHVAAMAAADDVLLTGRTTRFTIAADQMPLGWDAALAALADVSAF